MARKPGQPTTPQPAQLSLEDFRRAIPRLQKRIADLEDFDPLTVLDRRDPRIEALQGRIDEALVSIFGNTTADYRRYRTAAVLDTASHNYMHPTPLREVIAGLQHGKERSIALLAEIIKLFEERISENAVSEPVDSGRRKMSFDNRRVFVVHGHDEAAKQTVARVLEQLDFEPIILHEIANKGRTIIEKFEDHAEVGFAVVLFTPDDIGYQIGKPEEARSRARQNVLLELGFFAGAMTRSRVMVLFKGDVEIPSDYIGVLYEPMDEKGAWRFALGRELRAAGFEVDLNRL